MDDSDWSRRQVVGGAAGAVLGGLAGCLSGGDGDAATATPTEAPPSTTAGGGSTPTAEDGTPTPRPTWREIELEEALTGEPFTVEEFAGQPVLLEFFAVWCPVCTEQQKELRTLLEQRPEIVAISLNTDPNEGAAQVRNHVEQYDGFDWRFAVSTSTLTHKLVEAFGSVIANPPAAPVIRVCPGGDAKLLEGHGVKSADTLAASFGPC